jgi:PAS domain S-box-containing protein/putative nucleotidyltransferase with HDIG domain
MTTIVRSSRIAQATEYPTSRPLAPLSESAAQLIAESIPHIVWMAAPDGATTYFNRRGTDYTGRPAETNYQWNWVTLVHPADAERAQQGWELATRTEAEYWVEYRLRRFDGVFRWHECRALPVRDATGVVTAWIGTVTDIEDRKLLELALLRSEREATETLTLLQSIEASAPVGFKLVDRDLRIVRINETLSQVQGHAAADDLGRTVAEVVPELWPLLEDIYRRALAGESTCNVDVTTPSLDGSSPRHQLASYYPVRAAGEIIGVGNVVIDITARKNAEDAVARSVTAMVETIARAVEYRDPYTAGHQRRVAEIAGAIADEMGLDQTTIEGIKTAASIHDIGKIAVPAELLSKPGRLSVPEFELMKVHAEAGYNIVAGIDFPWPVPEMIRQHHERLDGSGYPRGLQGEQILLGARIIAVADTVEAMATHRPYRPGHGIDAALTQIEHDRGTRLDPNVVDACLRAYRAGRFRCN